MTPEIQTAVLCQTRSLLLLTGLRVFTGEGPVWSDDAGLESHIDELGHIYSGINCYRRKRKKGTRVLLRGSRILTRRSIELVERALHKKCKRSQYRNVCEAHELLKLCKPLLQGLLVGRKKIEKRTDRERTPPHDVSIRRSPEDLVGIVWASVAFTFFMPLPRHPRLSET